MAEHKDLPDAQLHEPKGAATALAGMVYIANGSGSGSWVRSTGWETHLDGQYTVSAPRAISAGVKTKLTINGTAWTDGQGLATWNTSTNRLVAEGLNYCYHVRVDFKCSGPTAGIVDLEYSAGGTVQLLTRTLSFAKGSSVTNSLVSSLEIFAGPDVISNGGIELYITPDQNISIWDAGIFIVRSHYAY